MERQVSPGQASQVSPERASAEAYTRQGSSSSLGTADPISAYQRELMYLDQQVQAQGAAFGQDVNAVRRDLTKGLQEALEKERQERRQETAGVGARLDELRLLLIGKSDELSDFRGQMLDLQATVTKYVDELKGALNLEVEERAGGLADLRSNVTELAEGLPRYAEIMSKEMEKKLLELRQQLGSGGGAGVAGAGLAGDAYLAALVQRVDRIQHAQASTMDAIADQETEHLRLADSLKQRLSPQGISDALVDPVRQLVDVRLELVTERLAEQQRQLDLMLSASEATSPSGRPGGGLELSALRAAHARSETRDLAERAEAERLALEARLGQVEKKLGSLVAEHMAGTQGKLGDLHSRMRDCEEQASDVEELRKGLSALVEEKASAQAFARLEKTTAEGISKLRATVDSSEMALQEALRRVTACERHSIALDELKSESKRVGQHSVALDALKVGQKGLAEQVGLVESAVGRSSRKAADDLAAAHAKLELHHGRLLSCEAHGEALSELKGGKADLDMNHAGLKERLDYLETMLAASADKGSRASEQSFQKLDQFRTRLATCEAHLEQSSSGFLELRRQLAEDRAALEAQNASLLDRISSIARDGSGDKRDLEELKEGQGRHAQALDELRAYHTGTAGRVGSVEHSLVQSSDKLEQQIRDADARLDKMQGRLAECEGYAPVLSELRRSSERVERELAAEESRRAELKEQFDDARRSFEKLEGSVEGLKALGLDRTAEAATKAARETVEKLRQMEERLLCEVHEELPKRLEHQFELSANQEKLEKLAVRVQICEEHEEQLKSTAEHLDHLKQSHHAVQAQVSELLIHHGSLKEEVTAIEDKLIEDARTHALELRESMQNLHDTHAQMGELNDSFHERLREVEQGPAQNKLNIEKNRETLQDLTKKLDAVMEGQRSLRDECADIEERVLRAARKSSHELLEEQHHAMEDEANKAIAPLVERLAALDRLLEDLASKRAGELEAIGDRVDKVVSEARAAVVPLEVHMEALECSMEKLRKEQAAVSNGTSESLQNFKKAAGERLDTIEGMLSSKADGHAKELAVLRDSHAELTKQLQASDKKLGATARQLDRHGQDGEAVAKRLEKLEREVEVAMESRADKHDKHVEDTQAVHDQLAQDIEELRAANLGADGKIARTDQAVADVGQRLEALRLQQGQSDQKHAEELVEARGRIGELERCFGEERRVQEDHREAVRGHLAADRRATEEGQAAVQGRLDGLEGMLRQTSDERVQETKAAAKEATAVRMVIDKLGIELQAREAVEDGMMVRVEALEKACHEAAHEMEDALVKVEKQHSRLLQVEGLGPTVSELKQINASLERERALHAAGAEALLERVSKLEEQTHETSHDHSAMLKQLKDAQGALAVQAREKWAQQGTIDRRIEVLERTFHDVSQQQSEDAVQQRVKLERFQTRLSACEAVETSVVDLRKAYGKLEKRLAGLESEQAELQDRLDNAESPLSAPDWDALTADISSVRERVKQLEVPLPARGAGASPAMLADLSNRWADLNESQVRLQNQFIRFESALCDGGRIFQELEGSRSASDGSEFADLGAFFAYERQAREAHEKQQLRGFETAVASVREEFQKQHGGLRALESSVEERLAATGSDVQQLERQVQGVATAVSEVRDASAAEARACAELCVERVADERLARAQQLAEVQYAVEAERRERETQLRLLEASVAPPEDTPSRSAEEQLAELHDRVQAVQRSANVSETILRKEIEDRLRESHRIWEAIDGRGAERPAPAPQRLLGAVRGAKKATPDEEAEAVDSYLPFPTQPLTSFLSRDAGRPALLRERARALES